MKHGLTAYRHAKCKCKVCTEANRVRHQRNTEIRASKPIPEHVHGSKNGYDNYRCRCDSCKEANSKSLKEFRDRKKENRKKLESFLEGN